MAEEQREPKPGDVIWADRIVQGKPYNHCGIYEGGGHVIHFAAPEGSEINQKNAVVHRTSFDMFADGCPLRIVDFPKGFSREETLRRARQRIGERGYDFAVNNCDHFATWCKTGEHHSLQADEAKKVIRAIGQAAGGPVEGIAEIICTVHDIAQDFKAPKFDSIDQIQKPKAVLDMLDLNSHLTDFVPPAPEESPGDEIPMPYEPEELQDYSEEPPPVEYEVMEDKPEKNPEDDAAPPGKKPLYERIGDKLKGWTYPIAGALEVLKRVGKLPPFMRKIDYNVLGAKVRNGIDKIVTAIKVFTGKITPAQAKEEIQNNETALLGQTVGQKQKRSVGEVVKQTFGKAGTAIKYVVQQAVTRLVPQPIRHAIATGVRATGRAIVSGIKTAAAKVGGVVKAGIGKVFSFFGRK
jgi:hypothetical protein